MNLFVFITLASGITRKLGYEIERTSKLKTVLLKACRQLKLDIKDVKFKHKNRWLRESDTGNTVFPGSRLTGNCVIKGYQQIRKVKKEVESDETDANSDYEMVQTSDSETESDSKTENGHLKVSKNDTLPSQLDSSDFINLTLSDGELRTLQFRINIMAKFGRAIKKYCKEFNVLSHYLQFSKMNEDGTSTLIDADDTPFDLELDSNSQIYVEHLVDDITTSESKHDLPDWIRHISFKLSDGERELELYKVDLHAKLGNAMRTYSKAYNLDINCLRFMYDGKCIAEDDTPHSLKFGYCTVIDVCHTVPNHSQHKNELIALLITDGENRLRLKIDTLSTLGNMMLAYSIVHDMDIKSLRFKCDGKLITEEDTPIDLNFDDRTTVLVYHVVASDFECSSTTDESNRPKTVNITIRSSNNQELKLELNENSKLKYSMIAFCSAYNLEMKRIRFLLNDDADRPIKEEDTPAGLKIKSDDYIFVQ